MSRLARARLEAAVSAMIVALGLLFAATAI